MGKELVLNGGEVEDSLLEAVDDARDKGEITWLVFDGERTAAIVPAAVAEAFGQVADGARRALASQAPRYSDVRVSRSVLRDGDTSTLLGVVLGAMRARAVPLVLLREFRQAMFDAGSYAAALALAEQTVSFE